MSSTASRRVAQGTADDVLVPARVVVDVELVPGRVVVDVELVPAPVVVDVELAPAPVVVDVELVPAPVVVVLEAEVGFVGHVGSLRRTLTGPPKLSHTPLSSPAARAAVTCSGVRERPTSWLLPINTEAMFEFSERSVGTRERRSLTVHSRPPRRGQLYVATEFAVINAEFKQTLMLRLQIGVADVVDELVDEDVLVTVVRVVDPGAMVLDELDVVLADDEVVAVTVVRLDDGAALLLDGLDVVLADDEDVPVTVVRLELVPLEVLVITDEVLLVGGAFGHVGSRIVTLTGPPRASQIPFNSPALIAAETAAGAILSPRTSLSPIKTVATSGLQIGLADVVVLVPPDDVRELDVELKVVLLARVDDGELEGELDEDDEDEDDEDEDENDEDENDEDENDEDENDEEEDAAEDADIEDVAELDEELPDDAELADDTELENDAEVDDEAELAGDTVLADVSEVVYELAVDEAMLVEEPIPVDEEVSVLIGKTVLVDELVVEDDNSVDVEDARVVLDGLSVVSRDVVVSPEDVVVPPEDVVVSPEDEVEENPAVDDTVVEVAGTSLVLDTELSELETLEADAVD
ncbi:hypothetical protein PV08_03205 [Exophiala spinifera]|uniref:Uncharacterized protein n=1 Tax=Exophiala spinifera TaxID=91928 RepID=A0A0D1YUI3_9EURO|nr:uncharacterized protein PV08_03205 [Exophiala spinifera]KIW18916.1 hypothetical protein PV08_03205 [Exophiala spinifera]